MLTPKQKEEVDGNGKEGSSEEKGGRKERDKEGRSEKVRLLPLKKSFRLEGRQSQMPATLPSHNSQLILPLRSFLLPLS